MARRRTKTLRTQDATQAFGDRFETKILEIKLNVSGKTAERTQERLDMLSEVVQGRLRSAVGLLGPLRTLESDLKKASKNPVKNEFHVDLTGVDGHVLTLAHFVRDEIKSLRDERKSATQSIKRPESLSPHPAKKASHSIANAAFTAGEISSFLCNGLSGLFQKFYASGDELSETEKMLLKSQMDEEVLKHSKKDKYGNLEQSVSTIESLKAIIDRYPSKEEKEPPTQEDIKSPQENENNSSKKKKESKEISQKSFKEYLLKNWLTLEEYQSQTIRLLTAIILVSFQNAYLRPTLEHFDLDDEDISLSALQEIKAFLKQLVEWCEQTFSSFTLDTSYLEMKNTLMTVIDIPNSFQKCPIELSKDIRTVMIIELEEIFGMMESFEISVANHKPEGIDLERYTPQYPKASSFRKELIPKKMLALAEKTEHPFSELEAVQLLCMKEELKKRRGHREYMKIVNKVNHDLHAGVSLRSKSDILAFFAKSDSQNKKVETERTAREEQERAEQEEAQRKAQEEQARAEQEEAQRKALTMNPDVLREIVRLAIQDAVAPLQATIREQSQTIKEQNTAIHDLRSQLEKDLDSLKAQMTDCLEEVEQVQDFTSNFHDEFLAHSTQTSEMGKKIDSLGIDALSHRIGEMEKSLLMLQKDLNAKASDQHSAELQKQLNKINEELAELKNAQSQVSTVLTVSSPPSLDERGKNFNEQVQQLRINYENLYTTHGEKLAEIKANTEKSLSDLTGAKIATGSSLYRLDTGNGSKIDLEKIKHHETLRQELEKRSLDLSQFLELYNPLREMIKTMSSVRRTLPSQQFPESIADFDSLLARINQSVGELIDLIKTISIQLKDDREDISLGRFLPSENEENELSEDLKVIFYAIAKRFDEKPKRWNGRHNGVKTTTLSEKLLEASFLKSIRDNHSSLDEFLRQYAQVFDEGIRAKKVNLTESNEFFIRTSRPNGEIYYHATDLFVASYKKLMIESEK